MKNATWKTPIFFTEISIEAQQQYIHIDISYLLLVSTNYFRAVFDKIWYLLVFLVFLVILVFFGIFGQSFHKKSHLVRGQFRKESMTPNAKPMTEHADTSELTSHQVRLFVETLPKNTKKYQNYQKYQKYQKIPNFTQKCHEIVCTNQ